MEQHLSCSVDSDSASHKKFPALMKSEGSLPGSKNLILALIPNLLATSHHTA